MCGILLIVSKNKLNKHECLKAERLIKSRGPDFVNNSFFSRDRIFLSNSILSITGSINYKKGLAKSKSSNYVLSFNDFNSSGIKTLKMLETYKIS